MARTKLCLVEDDAGIREALAHLFEADGFEVTSYRDGFEALAAFDGGVVPDVIVLDLMMPNLDGWSFRVEQRRRRAVAGVPVIVVSANASPEARAIDAFAYLRKPLEYDAVRASVERAVHETERRRATIFDRELERHLAISGLIEGIVRECTAPLADLGPNVDLAAKIVSANNDVPAFAGLSRAMEAIRLDYDRLRRTLDSLARLTSSVQDDWGPLDPSSLLESTALLARGFFVGRAKFETDIESLPPVIGNESRLGFAVLGLLVNAAQATEATGVVDKTVRLTARLQGDALRIEVRDEGVGMDEQTRARAFEPFFTTRRPGDGAGLGLSIALETVRSHGGELNAESEPGRGSTFVMTIPIAAAMRV